MYLHDDITIADYCWLGKVPLLPPFSQHHKSYRCRDHKHHANGLQFCGIYNNEPSAGYEAGKLNEHCFLLTGQ